VESANDILSKFRLDINFLDLHLFLQKAAKVVEELLREDSKSSNKNSLAAAKSDLKFSQGFTLFATPKYVAKMNKQAVVTNCAFCIDDSSHIVCTLSTPSSDAAEKENGRNHSSLFVVWDINEPTTTYRALVGEGVSSCLCYFSFIVISGNLDGSLDLWDLREPFSLHSSSVTKSKTASESNVIRSSTYTTGIF
jgi:hypothetical protein